MMRSNSKFSDSHFGTTRSRGFDKRFRFWLGRGSRLLTVSGLIVIALTGATVSRFAQAQPDLRPPAEERPPVWDTLTPQQRHEYKQKMFAKSLRQSLNEIGFLDKAKQDAILQFVRRREDACQTLRDMALDLDAMLGKAKDTDVQNASAEFQTAVSEAKKQRDEELVDLDKAVAFSTHPRLQAWLITHGITSDDYSFLLNRALYIKQEIPKAILYN